MGNPQENLKATSAFMCTRKDSNLKSSLFKQSPNKAKPRMRASECAAGKMSITNPIQLVHVRDFYTAQLNKFFNGTFEITKKSAKNIK